MQKIKIKRFTNAANKEFVSIVDQLIKNIKEFGYKKAFSTKIKDEIQNLTKDSNKCETVEESSEIELKNFSSRYDMGKSIFNSLKDCKYIKIIKDENLWNWLTGLFIIQLITEKGGLKSSRFLFRYEFHHTKLHLVRTSWLLYRLLKEDSEFALCTPVHQHSNMCEQFISRVELTRNPVVGKLCMDLYFDKKNGKLFPNSDNHRKTKEKKLHPGTLYPRLTKTLGSVCKTYDIWTIDKENLKKLAGSEFEIWEEFKKPKKSASNKNPTWTRNERIVVLKHYFDAENPIELSKDEKICNEISKILRSLSVHPNEVYKIPNFRSTESVRRKILNFCSLDPEIEEDGLENAAKGDSEIFSEFASRNPKKIEELNTMYNVVVRKN